MKDKKEDGPGIALVRKTQDQIALPDSAALQSIGEMMSKSGMFPNARTPWGAAAIIQYGQELGLGGPVQSLQSISVIEGKLAVSGAAMLALLRKQGVRVEFLEKSPKVCKIKFTRIGEEPHIETFSMEDAQRIHYKTQSGWKPLAEKVNYRNYPEEMLTWRCVSKGARAYASDLLMGLYAIEELEVNTIRKEEAPKPTGPEVIEHVPARAVVVEGEAEEGTDGKEKTDEKKEEAKDKALPAAKKKKAAKKIEPSPKVTPVKSDPEPEIPPPPAIEPGDPGPTDPTDPGNIKTGPPPGPHEPGDPAPWEETGDEDIPSPDKKTGREPGEDDEEPDTSGPIPNGSSKIELIKQGIRVLVEQFDMDEKDVTRKLRMRLEDFYKVGFPKFPDGLSDEEAEKVLKTIAASIEKRQRGE